MTADRPHGPMPMLLVCLTVVTGLVDAFSYLRLGHVFVGAHLDRHRPCRRQHTPIGAHPPTDLDPGDARGCAYGRCLVALGRPRRAALVGGTTAGRLRYGRLPGGSPPTIAGLAVAR
jgi:hypothetical protein